MIPGQYAYRTGSVSNLSIFKTPGFCTLIFFKRGTVLFGAGLFVNIRAVRFSAEFQSRHFSGPFPCGFVQEETVRCGAVLPVRQPQAKLSRHPDRVDDSMIQVVCYYLPAEVGTAEVTPCVTTYTLRCQNSHNPQYANIPNRYETVKLKRHNEYLAWLFT